MDIKLFKLDNEQQQSDFWNFIYDKSKSYLETIAFWDMCVLEIDDMRETALSDIFLEEIEIDRMVHANPLDIFVSDVDMAHKTIKEAFYVALGQMFYNSLEFELSNIDDGKNYVTVPFFQDRFEGTNGVSVVMLDNQNQTVAFRVIDMSDWKVGNFDDVYEIWLYHKEPVRVSNNTRT